MVRRLKLIKSVVKNVNYQTLGAFRLRIDAMDISGGQTDPNVFLYLRSLTNPYTQITEDFWMSVAGPVDMSEYPAENPNTRTAYPIFRLSFVEVDLRAVSLANEVWTQVIREVTNLINALNLLENLTPEEEVLIGPPLESGSSSSVSI
jgi:hypothetical protein